MTQREIVRRVIRHQDAPRIAWDFLDPAYQDIRFESPIHLIHPEIEAYRSFGYHKELMDRAHFHG